jgi:hypothetical protein
MASGAVADDREIAAAFDLPEFLLINALGNSAAGREQQEAAAQA